MENKKDSLREMFKGYSKYSEKEYKDIWDNAVIVFDTNILLNLYRYSNETRKEFVKTLDLVKKRVWIPYQVAFEYFKDKTTVIENSQKLYDELIQKTLKGISDIKKLFDDTKNTHLNCKKSVISELEKVSEKIENIISDEKNSEIKDASEEKIEDIIFKLLNNCVGEKIEGEEFEKVKAEGIKRRDNMIPPGYKDKAKEENGDYYIFYSMIKYAKENNTHIIFVTDDVKEDWYSYSFGKNNGGNYKLLNEFYNESGKLLLIYTAEGFMKTCNKNIANNSDVDDKVLQELKSHYVSDLQLLNKEKINIEFDLRKPSVHYKKNRYKPGRMDLIYHLIMQLENFEEYRSEWKNTHAIFLSMTYLYDILEELSCEIMLINKELFNEIAILMSELNIMKDEYDINSFEVNRRKLNKFYRLKIRTLLKEINEKLF